MFVLISVSVPNIGYCEPLFSHGIAMHGAPDLPKDFEHFPYVDPEAPQGGRLTRGVLGTFDSLNPNIVKGKAAQGSGLLVGRLMARSWDEPFTLYPWIAESVAMAPDRRWIRFRLNERAIFGDKTPITADDVIFSFNILKEKGRPNFRNVYGLVDEIIKHGPRDVEFRLSERANFETAMIMGLMPIYAKHDWQDRNFDETTLEPFVTSGPYQVKDIKPGRSIVYEKVPYYWANYIPSLRGQHNFKEMAFDYFRDENVMFQAFQAGSIDYHVETDPTRWQSAYDFPKFRVGEITREAIKHDRPAWVEAIIFNTRRPLFEDRAIRKALSLAFDRNWVNKTFYQNQFEPINSIYPNSELAYNGNLGAGEQVLLQSYMGGFSQSRQNYIEQGFDPDFEQPLRPRLRTAARLLQGAGWGINERGKLSKNGEEFRFEILLQDPVQEKIALAFIRNLNRLGISVAVRTVDSAQFFSRLNDYDYDMVFYKWHSSLSPGNEQLFYWGSKFVDVPGSRNYPGISEQAVDQTVRALTQARSRQALKNATRALDRLVMSGFYFIPLFYDGYDRVAYNATLQYSKPQALYGPVVESWWYDQSSLPE